MENDTTTTTAQQFEIGITVHGIITGAKGHRIVRAEVTRIYERFDRRGPGKVTWVEAKADTGHRLEFNTGDDLFPGHVLYTDLRDAVVERIAKDEARAEREAKRQAEWDAMTNAEQCASMGYGVGRYTGD